MAAERIGRYGILDEIAAGAQGAVYRAHDPETGRIVALKVLHASLAGDAQYVERFRREATLAASIAHPNIIRIYEVGVDGDRHFMALEYLPESLARIIQAGPMSVESAAGYAAQIADGLAAAQAAGVTHRDIKPQNVLIGGDGLAKVTDFGIARGAHMTAMTATGVMMGTPHYMSPEQANGAPADTRSDIYALGCVLYQMLAGEVPFNGTTPIAVLRMHIDEAPQPIRKRRPDVPKSVADIVARAMAKDPNSRFQTAADMAAALRQAVPGLAAPPPTPVATGPAVAAPPAAQPAPAPFTRTERRPAVRRGFATGFFALVVIAIAIVGILALLDRGRGTRSSAETGMPTPRPAGVAAPFPTQPPAPVHSEPTPFPVSDPGPGPGPAVLFEDLFKGGSRRAEWLINPAGDAEPGSGWHTSVEDGIDQMVGSGHVHASIEGVEVADARVQANVRLDAGTAKLGFRVGDGGRYTLTLPEGELFKSGPGTGGSGRQSLARSELGPLPFGQWHYIEIVALGGVVEVFVDGGFSLRYEDPKPLPPGGVDFAPERGSVLRLSEVRVLEEPGGHGQPAPPVTVPSPYEFTARVYNGFEGPARQPPEDRATGAWFDVWAAGPDGLGSVRVTRPDGGVFELPPYTDAFSPGVDQRNRFRFAAHVPESAGAGRYTFTGLDRDGIPIPGAEAVLDRPWTYPPEPPGNLNVRPVPRGVELNWNEISPVTGWFEPGRGMGSYKVTVRREGDGAEVYEARERGAFHLLPQVRSEFRPDSMGAPIAEWGDGVYRIGVEAVAEQSSSGPVRMGNTSHDPDEDVFITVRRGVVADLRGPRETGITSPQMEGDVYAVLRGPASVPPQDRDRYLVLNAYSDIGLDSVEVTLPDGTVLSAPPADGGVDAGHLEGRRFKYQALVPGLPEIGGTYTFLGLQADGAPAPGVKASDAWQPGPFPDPPGNVKATWTSAGILLTWEASGRIPGSFEPFRGLGGYRVKVESAGPGGNTVYRAAVASASHLVPGFAEGMKAEARGAPVSDWPDGSYRVTIMARSAAPGDSSGQGLQGATIDPDEELTLRVEHGQMARRTTWPSPGPGVSDATVFADDPEGFAAAISAFGGVETIDFESLPDGQPRTGAAAPWLDGSEWASQGVWFEAPGHPLQICGPDFWQPDNSLSPGNCPYSGGDDTDDRLNMAFDPPVAALEFQIRDNPDSDQPESVTFYDVGGTVLARLDYLPGEWVGIVSTEQPVSKVHVFENDGGDDVTYDNLQFVRAGAAVEPLQGTFPGNGHYYEVVRLPSQVEWDEARRMASRMEHNGTRGHLATITSAPENRWVRSLSAGQMWLGGFQPAWAGEPFDDWQWVTGEPWAYTNWDAGEPNDSGDEDHLMMWDGRDTWNDLSSGLDAFVVEFPAPTTPAGGIIVVDEDFEATASPLWSDTRTDSDGKFGRFLGRFGNDTVTLEMAGLPEHDQVTLELDLYVIDSWDGNDGGASPDYFEVGAGDSIDNLFRETFTRFCPGPDMSYAASSPEACGAQLGFGAEWQDAIYRNLNNGITFPHTGDVLRINFSGRGLEGIENESWGIDNVRVTVSKTAPAATATEVFRDTFDGGARLEWSDARTESAAGFGTFLGRFGNQGVTLRLAGLPPHNTVSLGLDLYLIDSWDGNDTNVGPDHFRIGYGSSPNNLFDETFSGSCIPDDPFGPGHSYAATPPDVCGRNLAYDPSFDDAIYRGLNGGITFPHAGDVLLLNFSGANLQGIDDESWGIDNVQVTVSQAPIVAPVAPVPMTDGRAPAIRIEWAYQPDGSPYMMTPTVTRGATTLRPVRLDLADGADADAGFNFATGRNGGVVSDVYLGYDGTAADYPGDFWANNGGGGVWDKGPAPLTAVNECPGRDNGIGPFEAYDNQATRVIPGHTYCVVTGDGAHYATLYVSEVIDKPATTVLSADGTAAGVSPVPVWPASGSTNG